MTRDLDSFQELAYRSNDGIGVRLLWRGVDGRVLVAVDDGKAGASFLIDVHAGDRALDVFHHPFAYAAWRGVDTGPAPAGELIPA